MANVLSLLIFGQGLLDIVVRARLSWLHHLLIPLLCYCPAVLAQRDPYRGWAPRPLSHATNSRPHVVQDTCLAYAPPEPASLTSNARPLQSVLSLFSCLPLSPLSEILCSVIIIYSS